MEPISTAAIVAVVMAVSKFAIDALKRSFSKSDDRTHRLIVKDEFGKTYNIEVKGDTSAELSEEVKKEITRSIESSRESHDSIA
jgi:hypothetical protein